MEVLQHIKVVTTRKSGGLAFDNTKLVEKCNLENKQHMEVNTEYSSGGDAFEIAKFLKKFR